MKITKSTYALVSLCLLVISGLLWGRNIPLLSHRHDQSLLTRQEETSPSITVDSFDLPSTSEPLQIPAYVWPPFNILQENGEWSGADVDIVKGVLSEMGYRVEFIAMPFKRILVEMKKGNYPAMLPCVIGGGREDYMLFSEPVSSIYSVLWKMREDDFSWTTYEQLSGRRIGASYYHYGAGFLEAGESGVFELDMVASSFPELVHFRKIIDGKIDMFICEQSVGQYIRHKYSPLFDDVDYYPRGIGQIRPFSFPLSKRYFSSRGLDPQLFISKFNSELQRYSKKGYRKQIFVKYHMSIAINDDGQILLDQRSGK